MIEMSEDKVTRRGFLETSWRVAAALAVGEGIYLGLRYLGSRKNDSVFGEVVTLGMIDEFPPNTITLFNAARVYLVRFEDGGFLALHTRCTHLACLVSWNEEQQKFICPCHGSQFERQGDVVNPPAPRPLDRFPVTFDNGSLKVDTSQRIPRSTISGDDIVYPPGDA